MLVPSSVVAGVTASASDRHRAEAVGLKQRDT